MVPAATHRAAGLLLTQRVLAPDASQDFQNHRIRRVDTITGATTTLAGSGVAGFNDDDVGTNARFYYPRGVAIAPNGAFALVAVRACPPCTRRASWPSPQRGAPASTHAPQARTAALQGVVAAATHRRRFAPRSACARTRCIAGPLQPALTEDCHRCASVAADPVPATPVPLAAAAIAVAAAFLALASAAVALAPAANALAAAALALAAASIAAHRGDHHPRR